MGKSWAELFRKEILPEFPVTSWFWAPHRGTLNRFRGFNPPANELLLG